MEGSMIKKRYFLVILSVWNFITSSNFYKLYVKVEVYRKSKPFSVYFFFFFFILYKNLYTILMANTPILHPYLYTILIIFRFYCTAV